MGTRQVTVCTAGECSGEYYRCRLHATERERARWTTEELAEQLHREFRAIFKALYNPWSRFTHDHGWQNCRQKAYFLNRARRLLNATEKVG